MENRGHPKVVLRLTDLSEKRLTSRNGWRIDILLPNLFCPIVRKNCPTVRRNRSSDREKLLKFEGDGRELAKFLRLPEQFIQTVKGQNNFW